MSGYDLLGPSYDAPADLPVTRRYVIAATPRSGSTMLAEGLMAAGMGVPAEYFDLDGTASVVAGRWEITDFTEYVDRLLCLRSRNGVFGVKVHWHQLVILANTFLGRPRDAEIPYVHLREVLEHFVPDPVYVRITRRDLDRQTVSHFVALRTGRWVDTGGVGQSAPVPAYDFEELERLRSFLVMCEQAWDRFFESAGVEPLSVVYEDFTDDYQSTMRRVVRHLGGDLVETLPPPRLRRQSGSHTRPLLDRYRQDRRRLVPVPG